MVVIDRNPQVFTDIYKAQASDFHAATQRVYRSRRLPSHLEVSVVAPGRAASTLDTSSRVTP